MRARRALISSLIRMEAGTSITQMFTIQMSTLITWLGPRRPRKRTGAGLELSSLSTQQRQSGLIEKTIGRNPELSNLFTALSQASASLEATMRIHMRHVPLNSAKAHKLRSSLTSRSSLRIRPRRKLSHLTPCSPMSRLTNKKLLMNLRPRPSSLQLARSLSSKICWTSLEVARLNRLSLKRLHPKVCKQHLHRVALTLLTFRHKCSSLSQRLNQNLRSRASRSHLSSKGKAHLNSRSRIPSPICR